MYNHCLINFMNIHEYQAQELFARFGVASPSGQVASTPEEVAEAAKAFGGNPIVVKSQVHAGGRGKGTFKNGFQGGVHVCATAEQAVEAAKNMLGQVLVTKQTGDAGKLVSKVLVTEAVQVVHEYYFAILQDRSTERPMMVASRQGGMSIEEVAEKDPTAIITEPIDPAFGLLPFQSGKIASKLGFRGDLAKQASKLITNLYKLFAALDCSMVEINPLVETADGRVLCIDAKFNFDDNALFRHPEIMALRDETEEDPREVEASHYGLNYIGLDGSIGCMVNGAGLAMATMDIIKHFGGSPANFLDVGGSASEEQVTNAFRLLTEDPQVKGILVNIFGGIMKCDIIAQGIINAAKTINISIPLVVRLEGTNVELGKKLLKDSGVAIIAAETLSDAAEKVVAATKN